MSNKWEVKVDFVVAGDTRTDAWGWTQRFIQTVLQGNATIDRLSQTPVIDPDIWVAVNDPEPEDSRSGRIIHRINDGYYLEQYGRLYPVRLANRNETESILDSIMGTPRREKLKEPDND